MRRALTAVLAVAIMLALAGAALATIPGSDGRITSCYKEVTGVARIVDASESCAPVGEQRLQWTQNGASGYELRTNTGQALPNNAPFSLTVDCPSGKKAVGGGFESGGLFSVKGSFPSTDGAGWTTTGVNGNATSPQAVRAHAICVTIS